MQKTETKNMSNNIELELRAEVTFNQLEKLFTDLNKKTKQVSQTKRLSAMFLGKINKSNFDIRVRISSNGKTEIVVKKGDFHSYDRIENSQEITKGQFIGVVKIFSLFNFKSKITERENFEFNLGNDITLVLVKAGSITYVEKKDPAGNVIKRYKRPVFLFYYRQLQSKEEMGSTKSV